MIITQKNDIITSIFVTKSGISFSNNLLSTDVYHEHRLREQTTLREINNNNNDKVSSILSNVTENQFSSYQKAMAYGNWRSYRAPRPWDHAQPEISYEEKENQSPNDLNEKGELFLLSMVP